MKLLVLTLLALVSTQAQARDFYSVKVSAKLYYSNMHESKQRMGSLDGTLEAGSDGSFASLTLNGKKYPITLWRFEVDSDRLFHHPNVNFGMSTATFKQLLLDADNSWLRSHEKRAHTAELVERYLPAGSPEVISGRPAYEFPLYLHIGNYINTDERAKTIQLHDEASPEALHLVMKVARHVKVR